MKPIIRFVVFGSRHLKDYKLLNKTLDRIFAPYTRIELVEGGQVSEGFDNTKYGADYFAGLYAEKNALVHTTFNANWDLYGNKAGPLRNGIMAEYCAYGYGVAFWDGRKQRCGTWDMIQRCEAHSIQLEIINI